MRVLIFGDSIAQGFWDKSGGWVDRLRAHYAEQYFSGQSYDPPTVFNLGVSSNSSNDLLLRLYNEASVRDDGQELVVVIAIGINDARIKGDTPYSSPDKFRDNIKQLLEQALKLANNVLVVGCTACNESLTKPVAWGETSYTNDRIWEFEAELRDVCNSQNVPHVALFESFNGNSYLLHDGLHPNSDGHELIYNLVLKELDSLIAA